MVRGLRLAAAVATLAAITVTARFMIVLPAAIDALVAVGVAAGWTFWLDTRERR